MRHRNPPTLRAIASATILALCVQVLAPEVAYSASSWKPTLLVNTESFQTIDEGDSTTDIEIRFGDTLREKITYDRTNLRFKFSRQIFVGGNITATGSLSIKRVMSGAHLRVDTNADIWGNLGVSGTTILKGGTTINGNLKVRGNISGTSLRVDQGADVWGTLGVSGATVLKSTLTVNGNTKVRGNLSGTTLRIDNNADVWGTLSASGGLVTKGNATINSDADTNDAVLTFGNNTANQTLTFSHAYQRFVFSTGTKTRGVMSGSHLRVDRNADIWGALSVSGAIRSRSSISGSTLTVDGNVTLRGQTYSFPTTGGTNGQQLTTNGAGTLTWSDAGAAGTGSGQVVFLDPQYPNTTYFASGTTVVSGTVGTLTRDYDIVNKRNYYRWQTSKTTNQAYWLATRVRIPTNFSAWQGQSPIQVAYRNTGAYLNVYLYDTTGTAVALTGGSNLRSTGPSATWATATITGPESTGTYAKDGYITLLMQLVASGSTIVSKYNDVGHLQFNFKNTAP